MESVYTKTKTLNDIPLTYCPGCGHGIVHKLIGEVIDELGVNDRTIGVVGVGCSAKSWKNHAIDMLAVPHGRPCAGATGVKRSQPNHVVFTYQGDGDALSIGLSETMYAAFRGENITVIEVNNTVYAMTGGQMSPTALEGQKTVTSATGRDTNKTGQPLHFPELIADLPGVAYVSRVSVCDIPHIRKAKQSIKKAFEKQLNNEGFSFVEVLLPCPSVWKKSPVEAMKMLKEVVMEEFQTGTFKE